MSRAVLFVLCLGLVAVWSGAGCMKCGGDMAERIAERAMETAVEKSTGGKVDIDVGKGVDLKGLPEFLRYPGAKAVGKWSVTNDKGSGSVYSFETTDDMDKAVDWFKKSIEGKGWKHGATMDMGEGRSIVYSNTEETEFATVLMARQEGKTTLTVTYSKK